MTMQSNTPAKTNGPTPTTPTIDRASLNLDQVTEALTAHDNGEAYVDAVMEAVFALRRAVPFATKTIAEAQRSMTNQANALQTATSLAQRGISVTGFSSPQDRTAAFDAAAATTRDAFWSAALDQVSVAKVDAAYKLAEDARAAIESAKVSLDLARVKLAAPLAMRIAPDADMLARVSLLREELDGDRPTRWLRLWETYASVDDRDTLDLLAFALGSQVRQMKDREDLVARFGGNVEQEKKAVSKLWAAIEKQRQAKTPDAFVEASAALKRLIAIFNGMFCKPTDRVRDDLDDTDPNWLRRAASAPVPR